jgi:hypothetical protein
VLQVAELRSALATEQAACRRAVQQYVDTLDANSQLQLQLDASTQAFTTLSAAHQELDQQYRELQQHHNSLLGQCRVVRDICQHVDEALALDTQLTQQVQQWQAMNKPHAGSGGAGVVSHAQQQAAQEQKQQDAQQRQSPARQQKAEQPDGAADSQHGVASDLQLIAERLEEQMQAMYASWRGASNERDVALTERFRAEDQLRDAEEANWQLQQQQKAVQLVLQESQQQLSDSQVRSCWALHTTPCALGWPSPVVPRGPVARGLSVQLHTRQWLQKNVEHV